MGILNKIFNKFSYPRIISIQNSKLEGIQIEDLCGKKVTKWYYANYDVAIYAKRNFDNSYNIYLRKHTELSDFGRIKLQDKLPIHKAINLLKKYDAHIEWMKTNGLHSAVIRKAKSKHHYKNIMPELVKNGIIKH